MRKLSLRQGEELKMKTCRTLLWFVAVGMLWVIAGTGVRGAVWTQTTGTYDWNTNANWSSPATFPNATGAVAHLTNDISGSTVVQLNQTITLGTLRIGDITGTGFNFTINSNGGKFVFNNGSIDTELSKGAGASGTVDEINVPIEFVVGNLYFYNVNYSAGSLLRVNGPITRITGPGGLILRSHGRVEFNGLINMGNGWVTKTDAGTYTFNASSNVWAGTSLCRGGFILGADDALPVASALTLGQGIQGANETTLDLNGHNQRLGGIAHYPHVNANQAHTIISSTTATLTIAVANSLDNYIFGATNIDGRIVGSVSLVKEGPGVLTLGGTNSYTGLTTINAGRLSLLGGPNRILAGNDIIINGELNLRGSLQTYNSVTGGGRILTVGGTLMMGTGDSSFTLGAEIIDGGSMYYGSVVKVGTGTVEMTRNNSHKGATIVTNGTLFVNGSAPDSPHIVNNGGTLGGYGTVGNVTVNSGGRIAPNGLAYWSALHTKNLTLSTGATYAIGIAADASYADQIDVVGTVSLGGATLEFTSVPSGYMANSLVIINNDGTDSITGEFAGLADGNIVNVGSMAYLITYHGGSSGNDVVLKAQVCLPDDTEPPTLSDCPVSVTVSNDPGACGAVVSWMPPTATDNCDVDPEVTCSPAPDYFFPVGTTTVQCAARDYHGNQADCAPFDVIVVDAEPPVISATDMLLTIHTTNGTATVTSYSTVEVLDYCTAVPSVSFDPAAPYTFPIGTNTVAVTATDAVGNSSSNFFHVIVQYRATPVDVVGWWMFDELSGSNVFDSTTNRLDGVLMGNPLPSRTSGVFWGALTFDGSQNYVEVPDASVLSPQVELTASAWFKPNMGAEGFAVSKWATNGVSGSYRMWMGTHAEWSVSIAGTEVIVTGTNTLSAGLWHLITGTYNGTNLSLYVDGSLDRSMSGTGLVDMVTEPLMIGGMNGKLDDVILLNFALTPDEVAWLYHEDVDSDGLSNADEVNIYHTNPDNSDTDGDTLSDGLEVQLGLDPLVSNIGADTDADGFDDVWEVQHSSCGFNPNTTNSHDGDADSDGWTDWQEYLNGTDPCTPNGPPDVIVNNGNWYTNSFTVSLQPVVFTNDVLLVSMTPDMVGALALPINGETLSYTLPDLGDITYRMFFQYTRTSSWPYTALSPVFSKTVTVDSTAPVVQFVSPVAGTSCVGTGNQAFIHLTALAYDVVANSTNTVLPLKVWLNGQRCYDLFNGVIDLPRFPVDVGTTNLEFLVEDRAGNTNMASLAWTVNFGNPHSDSNAPSLFNFNIDDDTLLPDVSRVWVQADSDDEFAMANVNIFTPDGGTNPINTVTMSYRENKFGATVPLSFGSNTLVFAVWDASGNTNTYSKVMEVTGQFEAVLTEPAYGAFITETPVPVSGYVSEKMNAGESNECGLVGVSIGGEALLLTPGTNGMIYYNGTLPASVLTNCSIMPIVISLCYTNGTGSTNLCSNLPLGLLEGYEILSKLQRVVPIVFAAKFTGSWCNPYVEKYEVSGEKFIQDTSFELPCVRSDTEIKTYTYYHYPGPCQDTPKPTADWVFDNSSAAPTVPAPLQPGRDLRMNDQALSQDKDRCGCEGDELHTVESYQANGWMRVRVPTQYKDQGVEAVILTFEVVEAIPSLFTNQTAPPLDMGSVKFQGLTQLTNIGSSVSFVFPIAGMDTFVISSGDFEWKPQTVTNMPSITTCGITNTTFTHHGLKFTDFHNEAMELKSITFTSDHPWSEPGYNLLKKSRNAMDQDDCQTFGPHYTEPEWDCTDPNKIKNDPITHTKDQFITITAVVKVGAGVGFKLIGEGAHGYVSFESDGTISTGGAMEIPLTAKEKLPNKICFLKEAIRWKVVSPTAEEYVSRESGPHEIFVTWDTPKENCSCFNNNLTYQRVKKMCSDVCAGGVDTVDEAAKNMQEYVQDHVDFNKPVVPFTEADIWGLFDGTGKGQCGEGAVLMEMGMRQIGIEATYEHIRASDTCPVHIHTCDQDPASGFVTRPNCPQGHGPERLKMVFGAAGLQDGEGSCRVGNKVYPAFEAPIVGEDQGNLTAEHDVLIGLSVEYGAYFQVWIIDASGSSCGDYALVPPIP